MIKTHSVEILAEGQVEGYPLPKGQVEGYPTPMVMATKAARGT